MTPLQAGAVALAGAGAGLMNAVAGAGTLVTFPVLVSVGIPPLVANVSNNLGLVPGTAAAAYGYRSLLAGQRQRLVRLAAASATGGTAGALALLALPSRVFDAVVPVLVALSCLLVLAQPAIVRRTALAGHGSRRTPGPLLLAGVLLTGGYGGYFGAAQGVLLVGLLSTLLDADLQRANATKNLLALLVNVVAAVVFVVAAPVRWDAVVLVAVGSIAGAAVGARFGRRLPPRPMRLVVLLVGIAATARLLAT